MKPHKIILNSFLKIFLGLKENKSLDIGTPGKILLVRHHNQLGDLIASTPILRAIKETFPSSKLTAITGPQNNSAYLNNPYLDELFLFDKGKLSDIGYYKKIKNVLKQPYDITIVPAVTSISFTSNFLARLSNSRIRIGVRTLNGELNSSYYLFDRLVDLDWRENEKTHITKRNLAIAEPFGITTENPKLIIYSSDNDKAAAGKFIETLPGKEGDPVIGLHAGAGKIHNRWDYLKFAALIDLLVDNYSARIFLTEGSSGDAILNEKIKKQSNIDLKIFDEKGMGLLKELINQSSLFITNDTAPMHASAASDSPVISLFGPTNPHIWAPLGKNKIFLWKSNDINNITVNEVYEKAKELLK
jgi:ADP-heptose:LPS heptosyltransferase